MKAEVKINRIKRENKHLLSVLSDVVSPEVLASRVPRLGEVQEAREQYKNILNEIQKWGDFTRATGFVPDKSMQYVAQIDQSVWSAILDVFARYDEKGEPMDDGLLYITDERGNVKLNRPFFYALLETLEAAGYKCDMRGKIKLH